MLGQTYFLISLSMTFNVKNVFFSNRINENGPVGTLLAGGRSFTLGRRVWWTFNATGLLRLILVVASRTKVTLVQGRVQV